MARALRVLFGIAVLRLCLGGVFTVHAQSQTVLDEARRAGRDAASFKPADENWFHDMDGGGTLSPEAIRGRNMWLVWTGGNDRFWDELTRLTFGSFDLLKIVSSEPNLKYSRDNRFNYFGLSNEPCFDKPTGPDANPSYSAHGRDSLADVA